MCIYLFTIYSLFQWTAVISLRSRFAMRHLSDHSFFPAMPPVLGPSTCHLSPRRRRLQENCAPSNAVTVKVNTKGSIRFR